MKAFDVPESDLARRICRSIAGRTRWLSSRSRVLAALLLYGVCGVILPAQGIAGGDGEIDWKLVRTTAPEDWPAELQAQLVAAGHDVEALAERVRMGQQKQQSDRPITLEEIGLRIRAALQAGELTPEEGREKMAAARQSVETGSKNSLDLEAIGRRIRAAIARGKLTPEEGREKMDAFRLRLAAGADGRDDRLREYRRGVIARAMAAPTEAWSDELKAAIVRAGWDLGEFTEGVHKRQQMETDGENPGPTADAAGKATAVEETSWGQAKVGIAITE